MIYHRENALGLTNYTVVDKTEMPWTHELKNWQILPNKPLPPINSWNFDGCLQSSLSNACPTLAGQIDIRDGCMVPMWDRELDRQCSDFDSGRINTVALHPLPREEIEIKWGTQLQISPNRILLIGKPRPMATIENWHVGSGGIECGTGGGRTWTSIGGEVYNDTELSDGEIICFKTMWANQHWGGSASKMD